MTRTMDLFCFLVVLGLYEVVQSAPEVQLSFGKVQGVDSQAETTNASYYTYYGIPFAQPPVGDLRFRRPQPYESSGPNIVISSDNFQSACLQPIFVPGYPMSEDCLYLNIFAPTGRDSPKKVMLWIYGGAFLYGDAYGYIPSRIVTEYDVIVVTFHYRVSAFGFLSSGNGDGNYGLYDQVLALQWVKDNIGQFNGDSNDITIFGESAGAASVNFLALSPLTNGLFTKGIMQSGSANVPWALKEKRVTAAMFEELARAVDCLPWFYFPAVRRAFYNSIMRCLRRKGADELGVAAVSLMTSRSSDAEDAVLKSNDNDVGGLFLPVVDGDLVPRAPKVLIKDANYLRNNGVLDRKYVIGLTNAETLLDIETFIGEPGADIPSVNTVESAERYLQSAVSSRFPYFGVPGPVDWLLKYEYTYPRSDGRVDIMNLLNAAIDVSYLIPTMELVTALTSASPDTDVYLYLFDHYPQLVDPDSEVRGTSHAMDILYEFDYQPSVAEGYSYYARIPASNGEDLPLFDVFRGTLTQFAKTGDPSRGSGLSPAAWPRYDQAGRSYLAISSQPEVRQNLYAKRVQLWTEVVPDVMAKRPFRKLFG